MKENKIITLIKSGKNVFTTDDIGIFWDEKNRTNLISAIRYYVNNKKLFRLRRGVYSLDIKNLNELEIASKIVVPSYISCETVLEKEGLSFQSSNEITSISLNKKIVCIKEKRFIYHMIKKDVFFNDYGVLNKKGLFIATKERAILDLIYIYKGNYNFEYFTDVSFNKLKKMSKIYNSKIVNNKIKELEKKYVR